MINPASSASNPQQLELTTFMRRLLKDEPLEDGVKDLALRTFIRDIGSLTDVLEWLESDLLDLAKEELILFISRMRPRLEEIDKRLTTPSVVDTPSVEPAIEPLLQARVDEIITATVQRLAATLARIATDARVLRDRFAPHQTIWEEAMERIANQRRELERHIADLAHSLHSRRDESLQLQETVKLEIARIEVQIGLLTGAENARAALQEEIDQFNAKTLTDRDKATKVMREITQLRSATRVIQATIPLELDQQLTEVYQALERRLYNLRDVFDDLPPLVHSPSQVKTLEEVKRLMRDAQQLLTPVRPPLFNQVLDREEELRRLAMIVLAIYTNPHDKFSWMAKRTGIANNTVAKVMVFTGLIDESELEQASKLLVELRRNQPEDWMGQGKVPARFKIHDAGLVQASKWWNDTKNPIEFLITIKSAISHYRDIKRSEIAHLNDE